METIASIVAAKGTPRRLGSYEQAIISKMIESQIDLLVNHYKSIDSCRKDNETASAVVNLRYTVGWKNGEAQVFTVISFAKAFRDGREDIVGDPNQTKMFEKQADPEEGQAVVEEKKSKKGKK